MNSKYTLSDKFNLSQQESPYDCETRPVDPFSSMLDLLASQQTVRSESFVCCPECHFEALNHASDCVAVAVDDFEILGKQHLMVQGLMCQNGCKEFATERVLSVAPNGMPIDKLVCEACAFGGVE